MGDTITIASLMDVVFTAGYLLSEAEFPKSPVKSFQGLQNALTRFMVHATSEFPSEREDEPDLQQYN